VCVCVCVCVLKAHDGSTSTQGGSCFLHVQYSSIAIPGAEIAPWGTLESSCNPLPSSYALFLGGGVVVIGGPCAHLANTTVGYFVPFVKGLLC
jgi:hypothetical protein